MAFTNNPLQYSARCPVLSARLVVVTRAVAAPTRFVKSAVPELLDGKHAEQSTVNFHEYTQATQMLNRLKGQASDLELLLDQLNALEASLDDNLLAPPTLEEPDDRAARQAKRAAKRAERRAKTTSAEILESAKVSSEASSSRPTLRFDRRAPSLDTADVMVDMSTTSNSTIADVQHLEELFKLTFNEPELPSAAPLKPSGPILKLRKSAKTPAAALGRLTEPQSPTPPTGTSSISTALERLFRHDGDVGDVLGERAPDGVAGPTDEDLKDLERQVQGLPVSVDDVVQHESGRISGSSRELELAALEPRGVDQVAVLAVGPSLLNLVPASAAPGKTARLRQARRTARSESSRSARTGARVISSGTAVARARVSRSDGTEQFLTSSSNIDILAPEAEHEVTAMCQDFVFLEKVKRQCEKTLHRKPTEEECAAAVGMDAPTYKARYDAGLKARELLLKSNYRLVMTVCRKYMGKGMQVQDLVSEGVKGLMRAAQSYDPNRGFRFGTYAHWWIRQAVSRSMAVTGRAVRLPLHMIEQLTKLKAAMTALSTQINREPTVAEMAEAVNLPVSRVELLLETARTGTSMESLIGGEEGTCLKDTVQDDSMAPEEKFGCDSLRADMESVMHVLSEREACVLRLRFGMEDGVEWTLEEVGNYLGVTRERIRQVEAKALRNLQVQTIDVVGKLKDYTENLSLLDNRDMAARTSSGTRKT